MSERLSMLPELPTQLFFMSSSGLCLPLLFMSSVQSRLVELRYEILPPYHDRSLTRLRQLRGSNKIV